MKNWMAAVLAAVSLTAGAYFSEEIKSIICHKNNIAQESFYERPYALKIIHIERNGKIETYLMDKLTKDYRKISKGFEMENAKGIGIEKKVDILFKIYSILGLI